LARARHRRPLRDLRSQRPGQTGARHHRPRGHDPDALQPSGSTRPAAPLNVRRVAAIFSAAVAIGLRLGLRLAGTATPAGTIAIRGAASGTHLRLSPSGSELIVNGPMEEASGCRFNRGHGAASCPLTGVGLIEVDTGPSEDKVEVLAPLPVPLT